MVTVSTFFCIKCRHKFIEMEGGIIAPFSSSVACPKCKSKKCVIRIL